MGSDISNALDADRIRSLNDDLRRYLLGGGAVSTPGIGSLGPEAIFRLVETLARFEDFCSAIDPTGEHANGAFDFEGTAVVFRIDYYDLTMTQCSPNPAD